MDNTPPSSAPAVQSLRERRERLRSEITSAGHWRRLVRAKIDLTVARGVGPLPLRRRDPAIAPHLPKGFAVRSDLAHLCRVPADGFTLSALPELRTVDSQLERYERLLRSALMAVTDQLVLQLSAPTSSPAQAAAVTPASTPD